MNKIYLYLLKRDRKEAKLIAVLDGLETSPVKIDEISKLRLQPELTQFVTEIVRQHRMEWELWMQSTENGEALRKTLEKNGCLYFCQKPLIKQINPVDTRSFKQKKMIRKI